VRFRGYTKKKTHQMHIQRHKIKIRNQSLTLVRSDANTDEAMSHNETDTQQSGAPWGKQTNQRTEREIMTKKMLFREGGEACACLEQLTLQRGHMESNVNLNAGKEGGGCTAGTDGRSDRIYSKPNTSQLIDIHLVRYLISKGSKINIASCYWRCIVCCEDGIRSSENESG